MIYTHLAAALLAAAVAGFGTWKVQDWRYTAKESERQEQLAKEQGIRIQRIDTAAAGHEKDKAQIRTEFLTITETVEKIVEKPVYRDGLCFDDDGLRVLRSAIAPAAAASQPAPAVPRPDAAH